MDCCTARENIGLYIDGELDPPAVAAFQTHIGACETCASELHRLQELVVRLAARAPIELKPPAATWQEIQKRLHAPNSVAVEFDSVSEPREQASGSSFIGSPQPAASPFSEMPQRPHPVIRLLRKPLAAAASLALFLGAASAVVMWANHSAQTAAAAEVDYSMLLDGLAGNVDAAVDRFFRHYGAEPVTAAAAPATAPRLDFALPEELPGGFKREGVYRLRFGNAHGVAARYRRGDEPLVVFFHPPMGQTRMGIHHESSCHVAGRDGQCVEVGPWQLVHFTDPTTCHCLLSKVQDQAAQAAIFAAVAPKFR